MTLRIAMWSGPRNISTAMMRAFENRPDTAVWDEPLYAYYLRATGIDHPMREQIIAADPNRWQTVVERLLGPVPEDKPVFYQKHMTHHLLDDINRQWLQQVVHCFLIRDPVEVLISYAKARPEVNVADIGVLQQEAIFDEVCRFQPTVPIIDTAAFLQRPREHLLLLCEQLGITFDECMLHWPSGPRHSDGVWAKHWYNNVWNSTGFAPYHPRQERLPSHLTPIADQCQASFERLYQNRLQP